MAGQGQKIWLFLWVHVVNRTVAMFISAAKNSIHIILNSARVLRGACPQTQNQKSCSVHAQIGMEIQCSVMYERVASQVYRWKVGSLRSNDFFFSYFYSRFSDDNKAMQFFAGTGKE